MSSKLIGRVPCPECDFKSAHVKQKTVEGVAKLPYRYCPECGGQYFPKNEAAAERLTAKMRPEAGAPEKPATEPEKTGETGATAGGKPAAAASEAGGDGKVAKKPPEPAKPVKRGFFADVA